MCIVGQVYKRGAMVIIYLVKGCMISGRLGGQRPHMYMASLLHHWLNIYMYQYPLELAILLQLLHISYTTIHPAIT